VHCIQPLLEDFKIRSCPYWEEKRQQGEGLLTENESNTVYQYKALRLFQQRNCVTVGMHDWLREWFYTWGHDRMSAWLHLRLILCGQDCICAWLHVDMITCGHDYMCKWLHARMVTWSHDCERAWLGVPQVLVGLFSFSIWGRGRHFKWTPREELIPPRNWFLTGIDPPELNGTRTLWKVYFRF
jgi:hypothetical protein